MFGIDFYPTPSDVIGTMLNGMDLSGKAVLEPSAGSGNIVDALKAQGAAVVACEIDADLRAILYDKCRVIRNDCMQLTKADISHVNAIVMNPPFSAQEKHLLHLWDIAPGGCLIISLCNATMYELVTTSERKRLSSIIDQNGTFENLGEVFKDADRSTRVSIGLVRITKPKTDASDDEFSGFFLGEDEEEPQENGIISYNAVRDLVNRYVKACTIYSELVGVKARLHAVTGSFFDGEVGVKSAMTYDEYKKALQKAGWAFIFDKMGLQEYTTKGVREDINKFVETQVSIPFTMRNIYHMLDIVTQTAGQRMDKALIEVFDRVTERHHDNRHHIKGWKTNIHYMVGKKFILPYQINSATHYGFTSDTYSSLCNSRDGVIPDFEKALCFVEGIRYSWEEEENGRKVRKKIKTVNESIDRNTYGEWYTSHFFRYKGYKNGNMHFEFIDEEVWARFNQRIAQLKGFPLPEKKEHTKYQDRQAGRKPQEPMAKKDPFKVLFEVDI